MFGHSTLRETWNTQWGPEPVLALSGAEARRVPITLPGLGGGTRRARTGADAVRFA